MLIKYRDRQKDTLAKKDSCSSDKKFIRFQNANTRHDLVRPLSPEDKPPALATILNIEFLTCFRRSKPIRRRKKGARDLRDPARARKTSREKNRSTNRQVKTHILVFM
jgi:hypothetical protein